MARPVGIGALTNAAKRHRAYELYLMGHKKSNIADALGVTKAAVGHWAKKDEWDRRSVALSARVAEQAALISQTSLAEIHADLQLRLRVRVAELEALCGPLNAPAIRLNAIKTWFSITKELEGFAQPKLDPITDGFIDDLTHPEPKEVSHARELENDSLRPDLSH